jgi:DNA-binding response OmpR family regulator
MIAADPHVLVADDDPDFRLLLDVALRRAGFRVSMVGDGLTLVREVLSAPIQPKGRIHLVITDEQMPRLNGLGAIEQLRRLGVLVPFVVVSGSGESDLAARAARVGAADVFTKPCDLSRLLTVARTVSKP